MHGTDGRVFEFGNFALAPQERLLLRGGEPVPLTPKAFDLLLALVRRSGHLVSKHELLDEVWPDTFVEEVNLSVNISVLRKALKRGGGSGMIHTVPKRGYRFVAPVDAVGAATSVLFREDAAGRVFGVRATIAQDLARELGVPRSRLDFRARHGTENADAYRAYLLGRHAWSLRSGEALERAIESFERAIGIDPGFAPAYSGLADCYGALGSLSYVAPRQAFPLAKRHALTALDLDSSLAEPHASLGYLKLYFDWDWSGAETEFRRAIELDPSYAATHQWYGIYLLAAGRAEEALRQIQMARERDALSLAINTDLAFHHYYTRRYEAAVKQLRFVLDMKPDFAPAHLWLGRSYQELRRFDEAIAAFRQVENKLPEWPVAIAARGFVEGAAGRTAEAQRTLSDLEKLAGRKFVTSYGVALVNAGLGRNDDALAWLDKAFEERSHWLVWLRLDPRWEALRPDPRFAQLVTRMSFPAR